MSAVLLTITTRLFGQWSTILQYHFLSITNANRLIYITVYKNMYIRVATAGKAGKVWSLPRFWVSIRSYKKQLVKRFWGRTLDLAWLKFIVAALL